MHKVVIWTWRKSIDWKRSFPRGNTGEKYLMSSGFIGSEKNRKKGQPRIEMRTSFTSDREEISSQTRWYKWCNMWNRWISFRWNSLEPFVFVWRTWYRSEPVRHCRSMSREMNVYSFGIWVWSDDRRPSFPPTEVHRPATRERESIARWSDMSRWRLVSSERWIVGGVSLRKETDESYCFRSNWLISFAVHEVFGLNLNRSCQIRLSRLLWSSCLPSLLLTLLFCTFKDSGNAIGLG